MLAAVFGILSAVLMFAFLKGQGGSSSDGAADVPLTGGAESVVVVTRDVKVGEQITADMITTKVLPGSALLPGRMSDSEGLLGKVATAPLFAGEQVISGKVTTFEGQTTLAFKIPAGMRALSLQVPHEAWIAAGLPQPGDRVDVIGITTLTKVDPLTGQEVPDIVAGVIAQDVEILAVSQSLVRTIPNTDVQKTGVGTEDAGAPAPAVSSQEDAETYQASISITLALTPDLAAKVAIIDAMQDDKGQYRVVPRQRGDRAPLTGETTWTLDEVFGPTRAR